MCLRSTVGIPAAALLALVLAMGLSNSARGQTKAYAPSRPAAAPTEPVTPIFSEPVPTPSGPAYNVNLSPPHQVGQKFSVVADNSQKTQMHAAVTLLGIPTLGPSVNEMDIVHLEAEGEVLAVFPNGEIQKVALIVKSLTASKEGKPVAGLPAAGAKIIAEGLDREEKLAIADPPIPAAKPAGQASAKEPDKKIAPEKKGPDGASRTEAPEAPSKKITIDGQPASHELTKLLGDVVGLGDKDRTRQDEFGPKTPVQVGATWPINLNALIADFKKDNGKVKSAKGTLKLDGVKGEGDDQVATISGNFFVDGIQPPLPPDLPVDSFACSCVGEVSATIPATTAKGVAREAKTVTIKFQVSASKLGLGIKATGSAEMKTTSEVTPR